MTTNTNPPGVASCSVRGVLDRRVSLYLSFFLGLTVACSGTPAQQGPQTNSVTPRSLKMGIAVPSTGAARSAVSNFANSMVFESLVGIGWDGRPVDKLVAAWEWNSDLLGLKLQFHPNLQFHDGTPIDIQYVQKSLLSVLKAPQALGTNVSYRSVTGVDIDTSAPNTVIIRLSRPEAFLLTDLANSTLPHLTNQNIGTGPFRMVTEESNVLASFDKYYRGQPEIRSIEVKDFGDQRASWAALMRSEIDAVHEIAPNAIDFVEAEGQTAVRTYSFVRPYYFQLLFNVRHPVLKNSAVRQALSYAVDRQAIIDLALNKQGVAAEGPIWPFHWAYSTAQKTYTHNNEAATLRLDAAGLKNRSLKPGQMPSRMRIRCLTLEKQVRYEKIALVLQKQLYEIGVDLVVEPLSGKDILARLLSHDFDTVLIERTSGRSLAWTYLSYHSSETPSGYTGADKILDRLRTTTSESEIRSLVSDLQQVLHDDPPAIFIAWPKVARAVSVKFKVPEEQGRDVMSSLWQWRPADAPK